MKEKCPKESKVRRAFYVMINYIETGATVTTAYLNACDEMKLSDSQSIALSKMYDNDPVGRVIEEKTERLNEAQTAQILPLPLEILE
jgi:hypothetical protein